MSLNYDALFKELSSRADVKKTVGDKARELRDYMELRWPKVNDISDGQRSRLEKNPEHTILISEFDSKVDGRPMAVVTVRHPAAVAKQASTGFVSRAVNDVG